MTKELSTPSSKPEAWTVKACVWKKGIQEFDGRAAEVHAQTWFDAREAGARLFGVPPEQVQAVRR